MRVSVIMPTYDQDAFLPGAVASLLAQREQGWELIVIDDGSPGDTKAALGSALLDPRVSLHKLGHNRGLGAALNAGLDLANGDLIAYLPSDDLYFENHLAEALRALDAAPHGVLCCTGIVYGDDLLTALGRIEDRPLQLVQVVHRRTSDRWIERSQLTTDDLDRMLWSRLMARGEAIFSGQVTCQWTSHPEQRSRVLREPRGGLNSYRSKYRVREPLRLHSTVGHQHDEVDLYGELRQRPPPQPAENGLRILLVGELAHNPERMLALEESGHTLLGLWIDDPWWFNTVGPLPFGSITDLPRAGWLDAVRKLQPDIVYALLNWEAIDLAHEVLEGMRAAGVDIPFVWHIKEGPFEARQHGLWRKLSDLHLRSDGQLYSSPELRDWFGALVPASRTGRSHVLDGDLPKSDWLRGKRSTLLSESDGEIHTVIAGRPMGPEPAVVEALAAFDVHVHVYDEKGHHQLSEWVAEAQRRAPRHFHLHNHVGQREWVAEFSQYDAGWLHDFRSRNHGDLRAAEWADLNYPARLATLAMAGVPLILRDNRGSVVAAQRLLSERDMVVLWSKPDDLAKQLKDKQRMASLRESVWRQRDQFTFDAHVAGLERFLREVIEDVRQRKA